MGAKLTKSKTLSISGKTNKQQQDIATTVRNTNNHLDITTNEDNKQTEKKKNTKKKEQKSDKKSSETKVDKSTNTENCVLQLSSFTEQLVGGQVSAMNNNTSLDINKAQINAAYQLEVPNKDLQELRDACFQNGILSTESDGSSQQTLNEHKYQANNLKILEEAANNASVTVVGNIDQVHYKEEQLQQQFVES